MDGSSIAEISNDIIQKELLKVVEKRLDCKNVELCVEPGSKKGEYSKPIIRLVFTDSISTILCIIFKTQATT